MGYEHLVGGSGRRSDFPGGEVVASEQPQALLKPNIFGALDRPNGREARAPIVGS